MKCCGIYGKEELKCGCIMKLYKGGKTIIEAEKCIEDHQTYFYFKCTVCNKQMSERDLKDHRWVHSY